MSDPILLCRLDGAVARLTLNDPDRANVLSEAMMAALSQAMGELGADPAVRVIVVGANGRIFCAGHDLAELRDGGDAAAHEALFSRCSALMQAIVACPKPVIARVQGAAVAAGCQLVASCDLAFSAGTDPLRRSRASIWGSSARRRGWRSPAPSVARMRWRCC